MYEYLKMILGCEVTVNEKTESVRMVECPYLRMGTVVTEEVYQSKYRGWTAHTCSEGKVFILAHY